MQRQHWLTRSELPHQERGHERETDSHGAEDLSVGPAASVAVGHAPHDADQADARQSHSAKVQRAARPVALWQAQVREYDRHDPDRDVDPEDPVPRHALRYGTDRK